MNKRSLRAALAGLTLSIAASAVVSTPAASAASRSGRSTIIRTIADGIAEDGEISRTAANCMASRIYDRIGLSRLIEIGIEAGDFEVVDLTPIEQRRIAGIAIDCNIMVEAIVSAAKADGVRISTKSQSCMKTKFKAQRETLLDLVVAQFNDREIPGAAERVGIVLIGCLNERELAAVIAT